MLVLSVRNAGVLTRLPDGRLVRVAECPQWADNGPGTKAFNEHLHHLGDEERARIDAELANRDNSIEAITRRQERQELLGLIDARVEAKLGPILSELHRIAERPNGIDELRDWLVRRGRPHAA